MGFFDWLLGREQQPQGSQRLSQSNNINRQSLPLSDQQAVERYRYMLQTAPPDQIEQAHEEAFAKLTPQQREMVLQQLSSTLPEYERTAETAAQADPKTLARMATRAELRQPGTLEHTFGRGVYGMSFGGTLLTSIAGAFVGSMVAQQFFGNQEGFGEDSSTGDPMADQGGYDEMSGDTGTGFDDGGFGGDFDL